MSVVIIGQEVRTNKKLLRRNMMGNPIIPESVTSQHIQVQHWTTL